MPKSTSDPRPSSCFRSTDLDWRGVRLWFPCTTITRWRSEIKRKMHLPNFLILVALQTPGESILSTSFKVSVSKLVLIPGQSHEIYIRRCVVEKIPNSISIQSSEDSEPNSGIRRFTDCQLSKSNNEPGHGTNRRKPFACLGVVDCTPTVRQLAIVTPAVDVIYYAKSIFPFHHHDSW